MKKNNKKTLLVISADGNSITNFRLDFLKSFIERDFCVIAIAPEISSSELEKLDKNKISFIKLSFQRKGSNPIELIRSCYKLYKKTIEISPDLIFSYNHKAVVLASVAGYFANVKNIYCMITGTGHIFHNNAFKHKVRRFLAFLIFRFSLICNKKVFFKYLDDVAMLKQY